MDVLITKKLTGQKLSQREEEILDAWLDEDVKNRKYYFQLKLIYSQENEEDLKRYRDDVWSQINISTQTKSTNKPLTVYTYFKWAAVFILVSIIGLVLSDFYLSNDGPNVEVINYIEKVSLPGQKITTKLPDGSEVKLNGDSKLIVPEVFTENNRRVKLIGEAFFNVSHDKSRPFIIETEDFEVMVLGTSFNVKAYPNDNTREVAVKTGKVGISSTLNRKTIELDPNQMVEIRKGAISEVISFDPLVAFGWVDQHLVFDENTLEEVFTKIERWYDVIVVYNHTLHNEEIFTGTFKRASLGEVLISVSKAYNLNYEINGKTIKIL